MYLVDDLKASSADPNRVIVLRLGSVKLPLSRETRRSARRQAFHKKGVDGG